MINQQYSDVSIELSPYQNLTREFDKEYGAEHEARTMLPIFLGRILNPSDEEKTTIFPNWEDKIFIIACAFAVLLSPLFCYLPIIVEDKLCFQWDVRLMIIFIALQVFLDLFYALDIFVFSWRIISNKHKTVKARMLQWLPIIPRIYIFLPISQAVVLIGYFGTYRTYKLYQVILVIFYPIQYTLRAYCTFRLIKQRPIVESGIERWFQTILDYLPFIIASHLFGALWYNFAVGRETDCWYKAFRSYQFTCNEPVIYNFYCKENMTARVFRICNMTHIKASCPIEPADDKKFDFGIYYYALRSNFTRSSYLPRKVLQSFWWGLKNLSSFGSNLEPSFYSLEICFCILTSISGLALFVIYINTRLPLSDKRSDQIKLRQKMRMMNSDIDIWLTRNHLSGDTKKLIKKVIMKKVQQKLEENKDVDVQNFFSLLPIVYKRKIMILPCLTCMDKVPMFKNMNIRVLKEIVKHLELMTFTKNCYIIREGEPLWNVLFITQGTALSYKTSIDANVGGSTNDFAIIKSLEKDNLFGEELLDWAFAFASISNLPISSKTVMSQTRVEAFGISANNLRRVVSKFQLHFILNMHNLEHSPLEHLAASSLQASWRAKANQSTGWNKLRELFNYSSKSE